MCLSNLIIPNELVVLLGGESGVLGGTSSWAALRGELIEDSPQIIPPRSSKLFKGGWWGGLINLGGWGLNRRYYPGRGLPSHDHTKQPRCICSGSLVVVTKPDGSQWVINSMNLSG